MGGIPGSIRIWPPNTLINGLPSILPTIEHGLTDSAMGPFLVVQWSERCSHTQCKMPLIKLMLLNSTPSGRRHGETISTLFCRTRRILSMWMRLFRSFAPIRTPAESLGRNIERERSARTVGKIRGHGQEIRIRSPAFIPTTALDHPWRHPRSRKLRACAGSKPHRAGRFVPGRLARVGKCSFRWLGPERVEPGLEKVAPRLGNESVGEMGDFVAQ